MYIEPFLLLIMLSCDNFPLSATDFKYALYTHSVTIPNIPLISCDNFHSSSPCHRLEACSRRSIPRSPLPCLYGAGGRLHSLHHHERQRPGRDGHPGQQRPHSTPCSHYKANQLSKEHSQWQRWCVKTRCVRFG